MTIEQVEKRINQLCEQEPDNIAGIRYWVGYRDALASQKAVIEELTYLHDRLQDWDRGMTKLLESMREELAKYKAMVGE